MAEARGQDVQVRIFYDGQLQTSLFGNRSATFTPGLGEDSDDYVGFKAPVIGGINGACELSLESVLSSSDTFVLADAQYRKNKGEASYRDLRIDAAFSIDFGDGDLTRISMSNCTLTGMDVNASGRTDKVTTSPRLVAGSWKRIS